MKLLLTALIFANTSVISTLGQGGTSAPIPTPTFSPSALSAPSSSSSPTATPCAWDLSYYGTAESTGIACDGSRDSAPIVVDGSCRFHPTVGYYEAFCSDTGGTLVFALAHCEEGCINCQPYVEGDVITSTSTSFISVGEPYFAQICYFLVNESNIF